MRISLIVAKDLDGVIGKENALPWQLPADLKNFRKITWGKPVILGRKTFESIGKPLPGRTNIVLTRNPQFEAEGCLMARSLEEALDHASSAEEVVVIGGAAIYAAFLPRVERIYLTEVQGHFPGDTHFPALDRSEWRETERHEQLADAKNPHAFHFLVLERRSPRT